MEVRINGYFIENNKGQDFIEVNDFGYQNFSLFVGFIFILIFLYLFRVLCDWYYCVLYKNNIFCFIVKFIIFYYDLLFKGYVWKLW